MLPEQRAGLAEHEVPFQMFSQVPSYQLPPTSRSPLPRPVTARVQHHLIS